MTKRPTNRRSSQLNHRRPERKPVHRTLGLEQLESRVVLAGNVQAFVQNGSLIVRGDFQDNQIVIQEPTVFGSLTISSRDGTTTINGQAGPQSFSNIRRDVQIHLGDGNDVLEIGGRFMSVGVSKRLVIDMGDGNDEALLTSIFAEQLSVNLGSGNNVLRIGNGGNDRGTIIRKDATIVAGGGNDIVHIANSEFRRLSVNTGAGTDQTTLLKVAVGKKSPINGGPGFDTLNREGNFGKYNTAGFEQVNFSVTPQTPATPPVAANDTATVARGGSVTINVAANDTAAGSTLNLGSIVITQAPANGTAVANADGTVTYTNNGAAAATDSFQYTIRNQAGIVSNAATVNITVTAPLTAVDDTGSVTEDATPNTVTGNVLTNDTGGSGTKTVTAVGGNAGNVGQSVAGQFGSFRINADGSFTYTLDNNNATVNALNDGQTLTDSIAYTASDGTAQATATLRITIQGHTDPAPLTAVDDTASITEDATPNTVTGNVLTNDTGGTGTKTVSAVNGNTTLVGQTVAGQFGTFQINADGSFTYTLDNNNPTVNALNNGQTLTDTMTYAASAGGAQSTATLRITIQGATDSAGFTAVNDTASITEDATPNTVSGNVLSNDFGGTGATTVTAVGGNAANVGQSIAGQFGTFLINADGSFTYTLDNNNATVDALNDGQTLTDSIGYTGTDGTTTSSATLTITIQGHTDPSPVTAVNDAASITEDAAPNTVSGNVLTNDTGGITTKTVIAVNANSNEVGQIINGQFGTFQINADGTFTYTLDNNNATVNALNDGQTLSDAVEYTASDGTTQSTATLTVTIQGHTDPAPLTAVNDAASITEDAVPNTVSGNVLTNDTGGVAALTVVAVEGSTANVGQSIAGQFGTFLINANGSYTYTLDNNNATVAALNDGQTLTDSVEYTASDGTTQSTATLTVTIQGVTD